MNVSSGLPSGNQLEFKWDWYQASIPDTDVDQVIDALLAEGGELGFKATNGPGQYASHLGFFHADDADQKIGVTVSWGGTNEPHGPHVKATGWYSPTAAEILRRNFPRHRVSRLDSCLDISAPGLFDYVYRCMDTIFGEAYMSRRPIQRRDFGFASPENGRTFYLGSTDSPMQVRAYEKGKKCIGEGEDEDPNWVRIEGQYRPRSSEKARAATLSPRQVFGYTRWSRTLLRDLLEIEVEPVKRDPPVNRTLDDKVDFILKTYGRTFAAFCKGRTDAEIGQYIRERTAAVSPAETQ